MDREHRRINSAWLLFTASLLLLSSFLVFFRLLETTVGGATGLAQPAVVSNIQSLRIAILVSDYTADVHDKLENDGMGQSLRDSLVKTWRHTLSNFVDVPIQNLDDADIEQGILLGRDERPTFDILVLPSTRALSDNQIRQIDRFMRNGGNVWATWALGIYRPDASWRSWDVLSDIFGVSFQGEIEHISSEYHIVGVDTTARQILEGTYIPVSGEISSEAENLTSYLHDHFRRTTDTIRPRQDHAFVQSLSDSLITISLVDFRDSTQSDAESIPDSVSTPQYVTLRANTPITAGIPAGYRLRVGTYDHPIQFRPQSDRTNAAAYWHDYLYDDSILPEALWASTSIAYGSLGQGRFVYMGFDLDALHTAESRTPGLTSADRIVLEKWVTNTLGWLGHVPVSWFGLWPYGTDAAAMLAAVSDGPDEQLQHVRTSMLKENAPLTAFVLPQEHASLVANPRFEQGGNLEISFLESSDGVPEGSNPFSSDHIRGYYSGSGSRLDSEGLGHLRNIGLSYILSDSTGPESVSTFPIETGDGLIRFYKTGSHASDILENNIRDTAGFLSILASDIDRIRYDGGFFPFVFNVPELVNVGLDDIPVGVSRMLKQRSYWMATGSGIADWINATRHIATSVRQYSNKRIVVHLSNDNGAPIDSIGLYIYLDRPIDLQRQQVRIRSEDAWSYLERGKVDLDEGQDYQWIDSIPEREQLLLKVTHLRPNEYRTYQIDFVDVPSSENTGVWDWILGR